MAGAAGGVGDMGAVTDAQVAAWTTTSCQAQGLAVTVTDPIVIGQVAVLLTDGAARGAPVRGDARNRRSQAPHRLDTVDVERSATGGGRLDDGVIEDRGDDGLLAGEVEVRPLAS